MPTIKSIVNYSDINKLPVQDSISWEYVVTIASPVSERDSKFMKTGENLPSLYLLIKELSHHRLPGPCRPSLLTSC